MIYGLVPGNDYEFRVIPINECGLGEPMSTSDFAEILKDNFELKTKELKKNSFEMAPKFTTPLNPRMMVMGNYEATLSCAVAANPYPKVFMATFYYLKIEKFCRLLRKWLLSGAKIWPLLCFSS